MRPASNQRPVSTGIAPDPTARPSLASADRFASHPEFVLDVPRKNASAEAPVNGVSVKRPTAFGEQFILKASPPKPRTGGPPSATTPPATTGMVQAGAVEAAGF